MNEQVTFDKNQNRYELEEDGHTAFADVRLDGDQLFINYVESPLPLRGKGTAGRLMQGIVDDAEQNGYTLRPICGYAKAWLKKQNLTF